MEIFEKKCANCGCKYTTKFKNQKFCNRICRDYSLVKKDDVNKVSFEEYKQKRIIYCENCGVELDIYFAKDVIPRLYGIKHQKLSIRCCADCEPKLISFFKKEYSKILFKNSETKTLLSTSYNNSLSSDLNSFNTEFSQIINDFNNLKETLNKLSSLNIF